MLDDIPLRGICATTIGIVILLVSYLQTSVTYEFTVKKDAEPKKITIEKPEHPEKRQLLEYYCQHGFPLCSGSYVDTLFDVSLDHRIDPLFIAALSVLESGGGKHANGYNYYGYCSGCTGFSSEREAISTVSKTLKLYEKRGYITVREQSSVWRTGSVYDPTGYPGKIESIIYEIRSI